jgi:hypothetical protein
MVSMIILSSSLFSYDSLIFPSLLELGIAVLFGTVNSLEGLEF